MLFCKQCSIDLRRHSLASHQQSSGWNPACRTLQQLSICAIQSWFYHAKCCWMQVPRSRSTWQGHNICTHAHMRFHTSVQVLRMLTSHGLYTLGVAKIGIGRMHLAQIQRQVEGAGIAIAPMPHHACHVPQDGAQQVIGRHVVWACHGGVVQPVLQEHADSSEGLHQQPEATSPLQRLPIACSRSSLTQGPMMSPCQLQQSACSLQERRFALPYIQASALIT